jgi:membrane-bound metal-dependent hydrolase YbcI (DUF457 family)
MVASTAAGAPLSACVAITLTAAVTSSLPDSLEKIVKAKHRTITHWPALQVAVIGGLTYLATLISGANPSVVMAIGVGVAIGCLMHSCADAMTVDPRGIALLWPISRRGYHLTPRWARVLVGTKSRSEWAFALVWIVFVLSYTYARYRHFISA